MNKSKQFVISVKFIWFGFIDHHIWHLVEFLFIFDPILQLNAFENSSKFESAPKTRYFSGLCISLAIWSAKYSGDGLEHQFWKK
jgi:hypothetical protein